MDYRKRIKQLRKERKWLQKKLAIELDVTPEAVCYWESLQRHPRPDTLNKICKIFNVSKAELFGSAVVKANDEPYNNFANYRVPYVSWKSIDLFSSIDETGHPDHIYTSTEGPNNFALQVVDDAMEPEFFAGDVVIVNPHLKGNSKDFVIVRKRSEKFGLLRQMNIHGNQVVFYALNYKHPDIIQENNRYEVIGVVVAKQRLYRE